MTIDVRTRTRQLLSGLAIAISVLLLVPFEPVFFPSDSATSWSARIVADFAEGRRFGVETVFNYGPLGLVPLRGYFPGTYLVLLVGSAVVAAAFIWSSIRIFTRSGLTALEGALLTALVTTIVTSQLHGAGTEPIFHLLIAFVPLLAIARCEDRPNPWLESLLGVALAIASLGKFNYFVGATGVIVLAGLVDVLRRRPPWIFVTFGASLLALWRATGQVFGDLPSYIRLSIESSSRYAEAMSLESQSRDAVPFVVVAELLALVCVVATPRNDHFISSLAVRTSWGYWGFLVLKTAVVRQDEHVLSASVTLLAAGVLLAALVRRQATLVRGAGGASIAFAFVATIISLAALGANPGDELRRPPHLLVSQMKAIHRSVVDPGWLERQHRANLAALASANPLPQLGASVDFLPLASVLPWAHGLHYRANPVVNSYDSAHSPQFAELQARHLRASSGPESLVLSLETIDDRYPSLDYGPSLLEMLGRYEVTGRQGATLFLSRRRVARNIEMKPASSVEARPGESVDVATPVGDAGLVWVRIRIHGGLARSVISALYRAPVFYIRAEKRDGSVVVKRYIPGGGEAGFLLSPFLGKRDALERFLTGTSDPADAILAFSIEPEPTLVPYMQSLSVELFTIHEVQ